ncbi:MAG: hypothetical protein IT428_09525 [Planctomycetaceae bacterium]|nr:hypothetical protein [Planctomycetaceae bacterium]
MSKMRGWFFPSVNFAAWAGRSVIPENRRCLSRRRKVEHVTKLLGRFLAQAGDNRSDFSRTNLTTDSFVANDPAWRPETLFRFPDASSSSAFPRRNSSPN